MGKKRVGYITIEKDFDVRTLLILMLGTQTDIQELINRNNDRFRKANIIKYADEPETLEKITSEYKENLSSKISTVKQRLASLDNGKHLNQQDANKCFMDSIQAVKDSIEELFVKVPNELQEEFDQGFEYHKSESLVHLNMFISHYSDELSTTKGNHMEGYVYTMMQYGYLFEPAQGNNNYSLLVFLSFYEAYAKRIVGLSLLDLSKSRIKVLIEEKTYQRDNTFDEKAIEALNSTLALLKDNLEYLEKTTRPMAKSCYFVELQKRYKGDIREFIKRFLIDEVDEENKIPYQKSTLIDKNMLRSGKCNRIIDPPVNIPTPPLIKEFFQISDSHYMLM